MLFLEMGSSSGKTKRVSDCKSAVDKTVESLDEKTYAPGFSAEKVVQKKDHFECIASDIPRGLAAGSASESNNKNIPYIEIPCGLAGGNLQYWLAGGVSLLTFLVYLTALWNEFVLWDDGWYVFDNPHIRSFDLTFFKWAFFDFYSGNWHPLTWISHALDYAVWGLNPLGHHLTNNILHAANTFLVVLLLVKLIEVARGGQPSGGQVVDLSGNDSTAQQLNFSPSPSTSRFTLITAGVAGLLFGLHPLHVESVAWVSERKDLLCALFYLLSVMAYTKYTSHKTYRTYFLSLGFFILALLSKPMAITLPVVLFILDWYPLSRIQSFKWIASDISRGLATGLASEYNKKYIPRTEIPCGLAGGSLQSLGKAFTEKIPFIVLGVISSVVTVYAQKAGGALSTVVMTFEPLSSRAALAAKSLLSYIWMMILPLDLIPLYPYPMKIAPLSLEYLVPVVLVIAITIICVIFAKKQRLWLAVWSYYVITLLPVIGLVPVGLQAMADRYTYLPSLGPFIIAGLLAAWVAGRVSTVKKWRTIIQVVSAAMALLIVVPMTYLTFKQIGIWKNNIALWSHVIEVEPEKVPIAYGNRGVSFADMGDFNKALEDYNKAIALDRFYTGIYFERGLVFAKMNQFDKAISDYNTAIELDQYGQKSEVGREVYFLNRGLAYLKKAQQELAISDFKQACDMGSNKGCDIMEAYTNTGIMPEIR